MDLCSALEIFKALWLTGVFLYFATNAFLQMKTYLFRKDFDYAVDFLMSITAATLALRLHPTIDLLFGLIYNSCVSLT